MAALMNKTEFTIKVTYFKPSGKLYTSETFNREFRDCGTPGHPSCFMGDVTAHIRGLRDAGGPGAMPGLSSDGWGGPILVDCEQGYPCLILPTNNEG